MDQKSEKKKLRQRFNDRKIKAVKKLVEKAPP